ncbi:MAG: calcium-binding protein [Pikeienuella sp.]
MVLIIETERIADDGQLRLGGASSVSATFIDGRAFVVTNTIQDRTATLFNMSPDGTLTEIHRLQDASSRGMRGVSDSAFAVLEDGKTYLAITSQDESALGYYEIRGAASISHRSTFFDDVVLDPVDEVNNVRDGGDQATFWGASAVVTFENNGRGFALVTGRNDAGLTLLEMNSGGKGAILTTFFDTDETALQGVEDLSIAEVGGARYFITAAALERGLSVFQVTDENEIVNISNFQTKPELPLARFTQLETVTIGDNVFVLAGGFGARPLTVFQLSLNGELSPLKQFRDAETTNLTKLSALKAFELEGLTYVAMGGDTGGISLYRMKNNGTLNLVEQFGHDSPSRTNPTTDFDVITISGKTYLLATGQQNDGIATYRILGDPKGKLHQGDEGRDILKGGNKGDILIGEAGNDRLKGKSGKDLLLDGDGKDQLYGGAGRDVFEFTSDGLQDRIQDFQDGLDLIDISANVQNLADVTMAQVNERVVRLDYDDEVLLIKGFAGGELSIADLSADDFILG